MQMKILKTIKSKLCNIFYFYNICQVVVYICICKKIYDYNYKRSDSPQPVIIKKEIIRKQPESNNILPENNDIGVFDNYINIDIKDLN
jgi:hypothetical protein